MSFCLKSIKYKKEEFSIFPFKKYVSTKKIIGIGSIEHGIGVTCISLALSNFLCNKLGNKTAYIELNTTNQICSLSLHKNKKNFTFLGIDFFPNVTVTSLSEILSKNYHYFILDMGVLNTYTAQEFSKCDKQFLVCSLCKWKKDQTNEKLKQFYNQTYIHQKCVTVLDNLKVNESTISLLSGNRISIPFIKNPFRLEPDLFRVFNHLLDEE